MNRLFHFILYVSFSSLLGCASSKAPTSKVEFNDDLSQYRVKYAIKDTSRNEEQEQITSEVSWKDVKSENSIEEALDRKLAQIAIVNERIEQIAGYRIQIYSDRSLSGANELLKQIEEDEEIEIPYPVHFKYEQPSYKIKIGDFVTKLEAHKAYVELREHFPVAIIIRDNVEMYLDELLDKDKK